MYDTAGEIGKGEGRHNRTFYPGWAKAAKVERRVWARGKSGQHADQVKRHNHKNMLKASFEEASITGTTQEHPERVGPQYRLERHTEP